MKNKQITTIRVFPITLARLALIKAQLRGKIEPCNYDSVLNEIMDNYVDNVLDKKEQEK